MLWIKCVLIREGSNIRLPASQIQECAVSLFSSYSIGLEQMVGDFIPHAWT